MKNKKKEKKQRNSHHDNEMNKQNAITIRAQNEQKRTDRISFCSTNKLQLDFVANKQYTKISTALMIGLMQPYARYTFIFYVDAHTCRKQTTISPRQNKTKQKPNWYQTKQFFVEIHKLNYNRQSFQSKLKWIRATRDNDALIA